MSNSNLFEQTKIALFQKVPAPDMEGITVADAGHYGDGNYVAALQGMTPEQHSRYGITLQEAGFTKYADNGETGINGDVFTATYTADDLVLTVAYMKRIACAYLTVGENKPLSSHLKYSDTYIINNIPGAKTALEMHQVPEYGNCFVIRLKNGHFIVNDGGFPENAQPLLTALEQNAPKGEKPVVEAWFVSHEHWDHSGVLNGLVQIDGFADRISVDGLYVCQVNDEVAAQTTPETSEEVGTCKRFAPLLKTSEGLPTEVYRLHCGQRYYFCDISVDVLYTQEQFHQSRYAANLNCSSTWLMYNIEGQKFLLCGDTELENMRDAAKIYAPDFWNVDVMAVHHHGLNLYTDDLGYFKAKTLLYSTWGTYSIYWRPKITLQQNLELQQKHCQEYMAYMDGGKRLTFPYTVGSAENLTPWYQEFSEFCTERQKRWLQEAGLA